MRHGLRCPLATFHAPVSRVAFGAPAADSAIEARGAEVPAVVVLPSMLRPRYDEKLVQHPAPVLLPEDTGGAKDIKIDETGPGAPSLLRLCFRSMLVAVEVQHGQLFHVGVGRTMPRVFAFLSVHNAWRA